MKNKKIKWLILFVFSFLFVGTSCSSNAYDGDMCGKATANGTNEFSEIRKYYVAEYIAEKNKIENTKYIVENDTIRIRNNEDLEYGNYLFVINAIYREKNGNQNIPSTIVANYIATQNDVTYSLEGENYTFVGDDNKVTLAIEDIESIVGLSTAYELHVADTSRDKVKDENIENVESRLQSHAKACIVFGEDMLDPETGVTIHSKSWGEAFKVGFLTGLIVYPVSWILNTFVNLFGGSGAAQVVAIIITTFILKLLIMLVTFKSTMSTHKMQDIQPQIAALQAKYGQNPTPEQRNRMGMEMMAIYKKYNIKPFAPFLSMLVTFPVFIAMYQAVIQTTVLRTGSFLGIILGDTISSNIIGDFRWGALVIFLLMATTQILSMKLPQLINKKRMSEEAKKAQKSTSMMTTVFMVMILFMGFTMPATMSVYWIASSIVSILQTIIMRKINGVKGSKGKKYKVKKVEKKYTIPQGKVID